MKKHESEDISVREGPEKWSLSNLKIRSATYKWSPRDLEIQSVPFESKQTIFKSSG